MASLIKRNGTFYLQWYVGTKIRRRSLRTESHQIAKDKLRQYESAQLRGIDNPLPTRTPIPQVVAAYVQHIRTIKTAKSAQTDVYDMLLNGGFDSAMAPTRPNKWVQSWIGL